MDQFVGNIVMFNMHHYWKWSGGPGFKLLTKEALISESPLIIPKKKHKPAHKKSTLQAGFIPTIPSFGDVNVMNPFGKI